MEIKIIRLKKIAETLMGISMMIFFTCTALYVNFLTMLLVGIRSFVFWIKFDWFIELLFLCSAIYAIYLVECKDCHWQEQEIHFEYKENEFRADVLNADIKSEPTAFTVEVHLTPKQVAKNLRAQGFGCRFEPWKKLLGYSDEQAYKVKW